MSVLAATTASVFVAACGVTEPTAVPALLGSSASPVLIQPEGVSTYIPSPLPSSVDTLSAVGGSCENQTLAPVDPLPRPGDMPVGSTMAKIVKRGYLIAGVDQDTYQFGYLNPSPTETSGPDAGSDVVVGFDIDIAHAIAQAIFGDPNRVRFKVITNEERISALTGAGGSPSAPTAPNATAPDATAPDTSAPDTSAADTSGPVDIVVSSLTINCQRAAEVYFSAPYLDAGQSVMVNKGSTYTSISSLAGRKVCAVPGTTSITNILPYHVIPIAAVNFTDCLVMLEQGQVDAISTDDTILEALVAQDPGAKLVDTLPFTLEPYGIAMSKSTPDLVRFVNGVLEEIKNGGIGAEYNWLNLYERWIDSTPAPTLTPPPASYTAGGN